jgi:hypothetical protein
MRTRGRPKTNALSRREQLRRAKQAQRVRQRLANLIEVQLALPADVAAKLAVAKRAAGFVEFLNATLDRAVVRLTDYPQLRDLAWNRVDDFIPAKEAFQLYERNWRLLDLALLDERERELIARLKAEFGNDEINA